MASTGSLRGPFRAIGAIGAALALLAIAVATSTGVRIAAPLVLIVAVLAAGHRAVLRWQSMLTGIVLVIFFIPIKRYTLSSSLPFNLEPYRVLLGLVALAWFASLLIDQRVQVRGTQLEGPIAAFVLAVVASVAVNVTRLNGAGLGQFVLKTLTFWTSFFILLYFVVSIVQTRTQIDRLVRFLVGSGAFVAVAALVEYWTHNNLFNHLSQLMPFLQYLDPAKLAGLGTAYLERSGGMRAYASSAHPIELSAVLVMLIPLGLYLIKTTGQRRWLIATLLLAVGLFTTLSRTGILMLVVIAIVYLRLRPPETRRLLPLLLPALCFVYAAVPHAFTSLYTVFFPKGGIVAQQSVAMRDNSLSSSGRLTRIEPALREWWKRPLLGEGFGSRVTSFSGVHGGQVAPLAQVLDDQWLSSLLEVGLAGVLALLWLFLRSVGRLKRLAHEDHDADGWLAVGLVASIDAFAVGMFTFDAFGFVQVTILLFLLLAVASALMNTRDRPGSAGPGPGSGSSPAGAPSTEPVSN